MNVPSSFRGHALRQRGVVLFITLIVLVALSLAAIALVRSVDTATIVSGNVAFKMSSISSVDRGIETAINWLHSPAGIGGAAANNIGANYYASIAKDGTGKFPVIPAVIASHAAYVAAGLNPNAIPTDTAGNNVLYVIERMCLAPGAASNINCNDAKAINTPGGTQNFWALTIAGAAVYRATFRVEGPRNTVTYAQAFLQ